MNSEQWWPPSTDSDAGNPFFAGSTVPLTSANVVSDDHVTMIGFRLHETFIFTGYALVGAYQGSFSVSSYTLTSPAMDSPTYLHPLVSPSCYAHPVITSIPPTATDLVCTSDLVHTVDISSDLGKVLRRLHFQLGKKYVSILVLVSMEWANLHALATTVPEYRSLFERAVLEKPKRGRGSRICTPYVSPVLTPNDHAVTMVIPDLWTRAIDEIVQHPEQPIVMTIGHGGQGKSTFNRLLLNTLLQSNPEVTLLDLDLGQPEMTSPGVISLTQVDAPILGGPGYFTKIGRTRTEGRFIGTCKCADAEMYLDNVRSLVSAYKRGPLVVNCMGWIHGFGKHVLKSCIQHIKPTWIVQLLDNDQQYDLVGDLDVPVGMITCPSLKSFQPDPELYQSRMKLKSNELRNLRIMANLMMRQSVQRVIPNQLLSVPNNDVVQWMSGIPITHRTYPQYQILLSKVELSGLPREMSDEERCMSVNGKLVGIVEQDAYVGIGIVRGLIQSADGVHLILATRCDLIHGKSKVRLVCGEIELSVGMMTWGLNRDWAMMRCPGPFLSARSVHGKGGKGSVSIRRYIMRHNK